MLPGPMLQQAHYVFALFVQSSVRPGYSPANAMPNIISLPSQEYYMIIDD